jgi:L-iditol 2-dehydrogenase
MYYNNRDVRLEEMPVPELGPGELLVRIWASGICGSDLMEWYRVQKAPLVLGHEVSGEVARVGEGIDSYRPGDRVVVSHHVPCNECRYCLGGHHSVCDTLRQTHFDPGGFAEYVRVPKINVDLGTYLLPMEVSYEEGSFIEPLGCVVRAQRWARLQPGQTVLVIGSGISGLLHVQLARVNGAALVVATDINPFRLRAAEELGAHIALASDENLISQLKRVNEGRLADLVIVCTGAMPAVKQALRTVERGGTILFFAPTASGTDVAIPLFEYWRNEITVTTSYAASPIDMKQSLELIHTRQVRVREMVTHRLSLAEAGRGFQLMENGRESIKVILEPQRL